MATSYSSRLIVERLNKGLPLIAADPAGWDNRFTLNPTMVRLERSPRNDQLIEGMLTRHSLDDPRFCEGVIAVYYRGVPQERPGYPSLRSSVGLAIFTPQFELLERFRRPVVEPTADDPLGYDYNGVEDQRITRIGDTFYMLYCGYNPALPIAHNIRICMAESNDLVNWTKLGPIRGNINSYPNKDAVIIPGMINGKHMMLHRPMLGGQSNYSIALAVSDSPTGEWHDVGAIMKAGRDPRYAMSWIGTGSPPIPLGDNRYLANYHIGNYTACGDREYSAGFAILNFNNLDVNKPESVIEARCDCVLEPETPYEINSPWPNSSKLHCVFPAGSCEYRGDVIVVYGGADAYVLGARMNKARLISHLESLGGRRDLRQLSA